MTDEVLWQARVNGRDLDIFFRWDGSVAVIRACYVDGKKTFAPWALIAFKTMVLASRWRLLRPDLPRRS